MNEMDLDRMLAAARATPPAAPDDFMARVLGDALAAQPVPLPMVGVPMATASGPAAVAVTGRSGFWAQVARAFWPGNAGVMAGLGAAALTGLWLGYADPSGLADGVFDFSFVGAASAAPLETGLELVPAAELFLSEG